MIGFLESPKQIKVNPFLSIAGTYTVKSPYHKNKKLPFNISIDGYVMTVEYKGWQPHLYTSYYKLEILQSMIKDGFIKEGRQDFPKNMKHKSDY